MDVITGKYLENDLYMYSVPYLQDIKYPNMPSSLHFIYHDDYTEVYEGQQLNTIYRFSNGYITSIENYDLDGLLCKLENFLWDEPNHSSPRLIKARIQSKDKDTKQVSYLYYPHSSYLYAKLTWINEIISAREFYIYDPTNQVLKIYWDDGSAENVDDLSHVQERKIKKISYINSLEWELPEVIEESRLDLCLGNEKVYKKTVNIYNNQGKLIQQNIFEPENQVITSIFNEFDTDGQLILSSDTDGNVLQKEYDCNKNLLKVTVAGSRGQVKVITYSFDFNHRIISTFIEYQDSDEPEDTALVSLLPLQSSHHIQPEKFEGHTNPNLMLSQEAEHKAEGLNIYLPPLPVPEKISQSFSIQSIWKNVYSKAIHIGHQISDFFHTVNDFINEHLSLEHNLKNKIEDAAVAVFGKGSLNLYGFYLHDQEVDTSGQGEISNKVRITLINGILNARHDLIDSAEMISKFHGGNNIHYIFRPTEGWTWDLVKSGLVKCGWASPQAKQLAARWRELIAEMGGVAKGGKIIHYAHSIGAADTLIAKKLMSPEELRMIQVYTFGSPVLMAPEGFLSVTNYVSKGDGVSLLDPIQYFQSLKNPQDHILFISSSWPIPFIDHPLNFPAYQTVLQTLGKKFMDTYGKF